MSTARLRRSDMTAARSVVLAQPVRTAIGTLSDALP
jgi:hypothetical protein